VTRHPARVITGGVVLLAAVIAVIMIATSGTDNSTATPKSTPTTSSPAAAPEPRLKLVIGRVLVRNVGPPAHVERPLRRGLLRATQRYVDGAIIAPLERGRATRGWGKLFDPWTARTARKRDLGDLTEVRMGFRRKRVHATASKVRVDALGGPEGHPALVALTWSMNIDANTSKGRLAIRRHTELTFAKEFGQWLVTAYQVDVSRSLGKHKKAATAASTS
jgi:hypothetical protein